MAGGGVGTSVSDGLELSLRLGTPAPAPAPAPAPGNNLAVVYDRRVPFAVDVVELQAIAIISTASQKITGVYDDGLDCLHLWNKGTLTPASPVQGVVVAPPLHGEMAGPSMKRSLQRFLEKRKARVASPYSSIRRPAARPPSGRRDLDPAAS